MSDVLVDCEAVEIVDRLRRRAASALETVRAFLRRIETLDRRIGAVLRLNPAAEDEARRQDIEIAAGRGGLLAGLPIALKDNLVTAGLETTCASRILQGFVPVEDATAVARLRAAGAVILCKTNMDEFAMGSSTENSAFGPTRNPWDLGRVPGGSSGGSAAAVCAGMAPAALGSDTGGSVRQPAAFCGIVGLKPTYGRVSRRGLVAFGSSLDQIGPLTRSVVDCARLMRVISGHDPADSTSSLVPTEDYEASLDAGVRGIRVGIPREYFGDGLDEEVDGALRHAVTCLESDGARVEEVSLPHTKYSIPTYYLVATAEASSNLARYDGIRYGRRASADGLRSTYLRSRGEGFGAEVKRRIMLGTYALSRGYYEAFYEKAQRVRTLIRRDFLDAFRDGSDVLVCPTAPTTAFRLGEKLEDPLAMYLSDVYTATINLAGLPAVSVPVGISRSGLPVGAQVVGPDFGEAVVLRVARSLERALGRPRPPVSSTAADSGRRDGVPGSA